MAKDQTHLHSMMLNMLLAYQLHGGTQQHGAATKVVRSVAEKTLSRKEFPKKLRPFVKAILAHRNPVDMVERVYEMYKQDNPDVVEEIGNENMAIEK